MLLSSADFFLKINFLKKKKKKTFRNTIRVSNNLDADQARRCVGPDLVPNHLQRLSADDASRQGVSCTAHTFLLHLTKMTAIA